MISEKMKGLVAGNSVIRAMFEEGKKMAKEFGRENVYDFSLGNPSVRPPKEVREAMVKILETEDENYVHGYMSNGGYEEVREKIAASLNKRFGTHLAGKNILMTVGAAGGLNVILKTLLNPGDEVLTFTPFFVEYRNYVNNFDGVLVQLPVNFAGGFRPDPEALAAAITPKTKALIVNTPNNPTGVVYSAEDITKIADVLRAKQEEYGTEIYLIADEPYRELAYDGVEVPYLTNFYDNTIVGYSYSKSLSLPGERIGYLVIPDEVTDADTVIAGASVANRILGFVNAPSLIQLTVAECLDSEVDVAAYDRNRKLLYESLIGMGYHCIKPEGAFYLFVETPVDDKAFSEKAKEEHLLVVPGSSFGCANYVRIAYCVDYDMIERSLPAFRRVAEYYGLA